MTTLSFNAWFVVGGIVLGVATKYLWRRKIAELWLHVLVFSSMIAWFVFQAGVDSRAFVARIVGWLVVALKMLANHRARQGEAPSEKSNEDRK